ncbi:LpqN/LpqT family lipoprotein [Mycobacterium hodleri]|uniref:LpqN/LpqT family lipoprotein n=1 Tax=Mycolicibacterium hodleri TaxID=49897 RepID=UPI0021F29DE6|nr:LpqN/LpqT family lipoprotein [Mycolicibacterium hodleri]MCV7134036.1 LpqN/LpqT family lipoprotein [Mycolicibacterium hodleri]
MFENARRWGLLVGGFAAGTACVLGLAGPVASAEPTLPLPAVPAPATVTQTVTVQAGAPAAAVAGSNQLIGSPVAPAAPVAPAVPAVVPATSGTLADFFKEKNVAMEPQKATDFKALTIVLPMPTGWSQVPDPNVPDAFAVIADRVGGDGLYTSNAAVQVYKLVGDFDPREAISHGLVDTQQLPAFRATNGSLAEFGGMPSALIEGTYRQNNLTLNTSRRHVIATSGPDKYLVSLSVTTSAQVSVAAGSATDAIVNGYRVGSPDTPPPAPAAPVAAPAAPAAPAVVPAAAQPLGLPR